MGKKPQPIVGLTTFSVLSTKTKGSYISSREKTWDEHAASILDAKRLAFRLAVLTRVTLPQLNDQTLKPDKEWFSYIVVTSKLLPDEFKSALYAAAAIYSWLKIVERDVDEYLGAVDLIKKSLSTMNYQGDKVPFLSFRLDDDDTLPLSFLERAQSYITSSNTDKFLTFSNGAKLLWATTVPYIKNYQDEHRPFSTVGLAAISSFNFVTLEFSSKIQTVFAGINHFEIKNSRSFIDDETPHMFIWSHHGFQDTAGRYKSVAFPGEWDQPPSDIEEKLSGYPHLLKFIG